MQKSPFVLILSFSVGSRRFYAAAFVFMLLSVYLGFLLPQAVGFAVDSVIGGRAPESSFMPAIIKFMPSVGEGDIRVLSRAGIFTVLMAALGGVCSFLWHRSVAVGSEKMVKSLRDALYSHIQYLPYEWHSGVQTGDIIQRCTSDVSIVSLFVATQITEIVRSVALVVFAYAMLLPLNAPMTAISFAFLPVILFYSLIFLRKASERFLAADEAEGKLLSIAQENFTGVRVVRAFGRERFELDKFSAQNSYFADLWMRLGELLSTYWGFGDLLVGLQTVTLCVAGAWQASLGEMTVGEFMIFLSYNGMIIWPIRGLGRVLSDASKAGVSLKRLREILDAPLETDIYIDNDNDNSGAKDAAAPLRGDIVFDHVSFAYEDTPVLKDISFTVKEGTTVGILGHAGSGKSTIAQLICRLYDLEEGCGVINVGGADIRNLSRSRLRRNIGIVMQEPFLYSRTIRENISSLREAPLERIKEAASLAKADEAIESFAEGYETVVGERGVTLSGGQKQRVAIARAVLNRPPIMIFDDSLSAVDSETDARIREGIAALMGSSTIIIIAHRITSVSRADYIIVMEQGRIAEAGSVRELLERGGIYKRIYDLQGSDEDEEVSGNGI
ncbi:ABC transporter permease [Synergistales bacterium]|nr:ABC transporter permease [Synergistales bacterium]